MRIFFVILFSPLLLFSQESSLVGDVDCNGEINSEDASLILQFVTNFISELPCQDNINGLTPNQLQEIIATLNESVSVLTNMPTMASFASSESLGWSSALIYCRNLDESGYADWYLPSSNELTYVLSRFDLVDDPVDPQTLWSRTIDPNDHNRVHGVTLNPDGYATSGLITHPDYLYLCRCVR